VEQATPWVQAWGSAWALGSVAKRAPDMADASGIQKAGAKGMATVDQWALEMAGASAQARGAASALVLEHDSEAR
jgi:hypothetical protein